MEKLTTYFKPLIGAVALAASLQAGAVPARPGVVTIVQPDGTEVPVSIHGDEHCNWLAAPEGFTLLRDTQGYLTFARSVNNRLEPSELRYDGAASIRRARAKGITPNLRPEKGQGTLRTRKAQSTQIDGTFPATGKHKLLMLLVNFADTKPTYSADQFDAYMNEKGFGGIGSFRDFYLENSYGKLDITTTVTQWVTVPYPKSYYNTDNADALITDALSMIDSEIDLNDFDNDGDGMLDGLAVIHQGTGAEASGSSRDIWSHSGTIYGKSFDGVRLGRYTIEPEILYNKSNPNQMATIGVMCHEFGHNLGAPDFYDTDYEGSNGEFPGTGVWDLMGGGAWNGPDFSGTRPASINMWQKIQLGWVEPVVLSESATINGVKPAHENPVAYRFDTTEPGEYFIVENRQQQGNFDSALPGHGLIVYHANDNMIAENVYSNTLNSRYPQAMYTVCAGAASDPDANPYSYGNVDSNFAPFPGAAQVSIFHDTALPSTKSISGRYSYKGLTQITENADGTIDFRFLSYEMPETPRNFNVTARAGTITLTWDEPKSETPTEYTVYRNNEVIATVTTPGYVDTDPASDGYITYEVDAKYASGLISPTSRAQIFMPVNFAASLTGSTNKQEVTLNWDIPTRLSRMPDMNSTFTIHDYTSKSIEIGHRLRAEDLAIFKGYDIRYINFLALQPQSALNVSIRVYETAPGSDDFTIVSERKVSEFANMQWTNSLLSKSVRITGEKDIIIAVRFENKNAASIQVLTDNSPVAGALGNLSRTNDGAWVEDSRAEGNFFVAATLRASNQTSDLVPEMKPVTDFIADSAFPIGFVVYCDGNEIGRTEGHSFTHQAESGTHTYTVTSLFKGHNESVATPVEITVDESGVENVVADSDLNSTVRYFDIQGRQLDNEPQHGIYIRVQGSQTTKVIR